MTPPTGTRPRNGRSVKQMGYNFEVHVLERLKDIDPDAKRNGSVYGSKDRGDLDVPGLDLIVQCKNTKNQGVLNVLDAAKAQAGEAERSDWAVVHRYRRGNAYGSHDRNPWTFEEDFALELLNLWGLWKAGVVLYREPEHSNAATSDLHGPLLLLPRMGTTAHRGRPVESV